MLDISPDAHAAPYEPGAAGASPAEPWRIRRTPGVFLGGALLVGALALVVFGGHEPVRNRRNHVRAARSERPGTGTPDIVSAAEAIPDEALGTVLPPARRIRLRRTRRVTGICLDALLVGAFALAVFVGYGLVGNRWYHVLAVGGGSMAPAIEPGDLIVLARPPQTLEPGMILTFEVDGQVVTHRVVDVHADGTFVTRGDANSVDDRYSQDQVRVVGQVLFRIPFLGNMLTLLDGPRQPASAAWFAGRAEARGMAEAAAATASTPDEEMVDLDTSPDPDAVPDPEPPASDVPSPGSGPPDTGAPPGP